MTGILAPHELPESQSSIACPGRAGVAGRRSTYRVCSAQGVSGFENSAPSTNNRTRSWKNAMWLVIAEHSSVGFG